MTNTKLVSAGRSRRRRPAKILKDKVMVYLTHEEKRQIEESARELGVSLSQYMADRALDHARRVLSRRKSTPDSHRRLNPPTAQN